MDFKKAHVIGIGGVGMSAVAKLLKDTGVIVTGSDEEIYDPIASFLREQQFDVKTPYSAANIPADTEAFVIGKNAKLIPETNSEVAAAMQSGKPIFSFPQILAQLSAQKGTVVVAGSYGKSTSTALLSHCLESAGLNPSFFIGASPLSPRTSAQMGSGNLFVLEGDEYPSSNTDPRSKFLHYHPKHLLITPLAHDHFNIFKTPHAYLAPFKELLTLPPSDGTIIVCTEGPLSKEFLAGATRPVITYGVNEGDYTAGNIEWGEHTSFDILHKGAVVTRVEMSQLGEHNIQNIVGVAALLFVLQLVSPEQFKQAVASFNGIRRRLDRKSDKTIIPIFEGFGSSYEKMISAIAAMKLHFPQKRLLVVFEPNTFSWRNRESLAWYDTVFTGTAKVFVFNPPHDGKETQLSTEEIAERVNRSGVPAVATQTPEQVLALLQEELRESDVVLLSSSGAMGNLIHTIPALAEKKFPK